MMETVSTVNGTKNPQTIPKDSQESPTNYMDYFKELTPKEAQVLKKRVRIDSKLHHFISRVLLSVQNGNEVPVPADFPVDPKPLKTAIKKVARGMGVSVRFDASVQGGFLVRAATTQEEVEAEQTRKRFKK